MNESSSSQSATGRAQGSADGRPDAADGRPQGSPLLYRESATPLDSSPPGAKQVNEWLAARNILAVRLDNIGDVIMLGPALRAVKETSPEARLTLLASPAGATTAPLLPEIDDVIIWRPVWQDVGGRIPFDPARERAFIDMLAERQFDAALIFTSFSQTPHVPGYVCYLAGIPLRAGESKEFGGSTLTAELRSAHDELHQVERNLQLIEQLGFRVRDRQLRVLISDEARAAVPRLLTSLEIDLAAPFILLHPGASAKARRYAAQRFGMLAHLLTERGWQVLVTAVERETPLIGEVRQVAPKAKYLIGGTTLSEYAALIERAALVICNDTLPMHLADAVRTPEVVLFSGTDYEEQWRPRVAPSRLLRRPTPCHPCYLFECPIGLPCLDIPPEEVIKEVEALLAEVGIVSSQGDYAVPDQSANAPRWLASCSVLTHPACSYPSGQRRYALTESPRLCAASQSDRTIGNETSSGESGGLTRTLRGQAGCKEKEKGSSGVIEGVNQ